MRLRRLSGGGRGRGGGGGGAARTLEQLDARVDEDRLRQPGSDALQNGGKGVGGGRLAGGGGWGAVGVLL